MPTAMKTLEITIPEQVAKELEYFVNEGWFVTQSDVVRAALLEYLRRNRLELTEQFQREDIAWALAQKRK